MGGDEAIFRRVALKRDPQAALRVVLGALAPVGEAAAAAVAARAFFRDYDSGDWLLKAGERAEYCFLIIKGLVRELYIDDDGEEHTRSFIPENQVTGSLLDLISGEAAVTWIQALEPTETLAWRYSDFDAATARFPELQAAARRHAEALYVRKTLREHEMLALGASERYARWMEKNGALDGRVSKKQLASYLGITPEHLSRLRSARTRRRRGPAPKRSS